MLIFVVQPCWSHTCFISQVCIAVSPAHEGWCRIKQCSVWVTLSWNPQMSCRFNLRLKWGLFWKFFALLLNFSLSLWIWQKLYGETFWESDVASGENQMCFHVMMNKFWLPISTQHSWLFSWLIDLNHFLLMRHLYSRFLQYFPLTVRSKPIYTYVQTLKSRINCLMRLD